MMLSSFSIASSNATEGRPETEGGSGVVGVFDPLQI
jgi:hypothetical protein